MQISAGLVSLCTVDSLLILFCIGGVYDAGLSALENDSAEFGHTVLCLRKDFCVNAAYFYLHTTCSEASSSVVSNISRTKFPCMHESMLRLCETEIVFSEQIGARDTGFLGIC